jgi:hypothetical protein
MMVRLNVAQCLSTRGAAGQTTGTVAADLAVVKGIAQQFASLNILRLDEPTDSKHRVLTYWGNWKDLATRIKFSTKLGTKDLFESKEDTIDRLMTSGDGSCFVWARFGLSALELQGVKLPKDSPPVFEIAPKPQDNVRPLIAVREWKPEPKPQTVDQGVKKFGFSSHNFVLPGKPFVDLAGKEYNFVMKNSDGNRSRQTECLIVYKIDKESLKNKDHCAPHTEQAGRIVLETAPCRTQKPTPVPTTCTVPVK